MAKWIILGVQVTNRVENIPDVQKILTEHGCNIKTRLGLHEVTESHCSNVGLLILETYGNETDILQMETKLKKMKGLTVKKMVFQK
jgi:phosphopentomutase